MTSRVPAFIGVGVVGFVVQMVTLFCLTHVWHWSYLAATTIAVEAAVLHNFAWHERWTWADRRGRSSGAVERLWRFHLGNGATSIFGNIIITALAVEQLRLAPLAANTFAVIVTSAVNYLLADRWVFKRVPVALLAAVWLLLPDPLAAAQLQPETIAAWNRHVAATELTLRDHENEPPLDAPEGRSLRVPGGTIHEWRGSTVVPGTTVEAIVHALQVPGLPPPAEDILEAHVMRRRGDTLHLFMRITRSAVVTVTYDTEHDVTFERRRDGFATSRSVATSIRETGGDDHGFLWRLNSYWWYRQRGNDVVIDVLSLSLSRDVPSLLRPIASPVIDRVARESMRRTLDAVERFGAARSGSAVDAKAPSRRDH